MGVGMNIHLPAILEFTFCARVLTRFSIRETWQVGKTSLTVGALRFWAKVGWDAGDGSKPARFCHIFHVEGGNAHPYTFRYFRSCLKWNLHHMDDFPTCLASGHWRVPLSSSQVATPIHRESQNRFRLLKGWPMRSIHQPIKPFLHCVVWPKFFEQTRSGIQPECWLRIRKLEVQGPSNSYF